MKKPFLLLILFCLSLASIGISKPDSENKNPNVLYFKLKNGIEDNIPLYTNGIINNTITPIISTEITEYILKLPILELSKPFKSASLSSIYRLTLIPGRGIQSEEVAGKLSNMRSIQFAEPAKIYQQFFVPNDTTAKQWYLDDLQAFWGWDISLGSVAIKVAIIDDACKISHPDLSPIIWTNTGEIPANNLDDDSNGFIDDVHGWDASDLDGNPEPVDSLGLWEFLGVFTHGTHCAGIAGAATNNAYGICSVGSGISIIPVKAIPDNTLFPGGIENGIEGLDYAITAGADVISLSWGSTSVDSTLAYAIAAAIAADIVVVAAAGNDGTNTAFYPAAFPGVIAVGATTKNDIKAGFSNYGSYIDIMAPGDSIWSTLAWSNPFGYESGTSMACPMVAGLCALLLSHDSTLSAIQVESCIESGADNIDAVNPSYAGQLGAGRINVRGALLCMNVTDAPSKEIFNLNVYPNPFTDILNLKNITCNSDLIMTSSLGAIILHTQISESSTILQLDYLQPGIYFMELKSKNGISMYHKLVKIN